jgi:hypothetical protein
MSVIEILTRLHDSARPSRLTSFSSAANRAEYRGLIPGRDGALLSAELREVFREVFSDAYLGANKNQLYYTPRSEPGEGVACATVFLST